MLGNKTGSWNLQIRLVSSSSSLDECSNGSQVSLMPQKVGGNLAFAPEIDSIRNGMQTHWVMSEKKATEIDAFDAVKHGVQSRYLSNIIANKVQ